MLPFAHLADLYAFQQAITGFKVAFDNACRNTRCSLYDSSGFFSSKGLQDVESKVQLWYSEKLMPNTQHIEWRACTITIQLSAARPSFPAFLDV